MREKLEREISKMTAFKKKRTEGNTNVPIRVENLLIQLCWGKIIDSE